MCRIQGLCTAKAAVEQRLTIATLENAAGEQRLILASEGKAAVQQRLGQVIEEKAAAAAQQADDLLQRLNQKDNVSGPTPYLHRRHSSCLYAGDPAVCRVLQ